LIPLQPDTSYHIFNHANGFENVFRETENYRYFLEKYRLYITPIAETYAWCLMPNHFHLVVRIRKREALEKILQNNNNFSKVSNFGKANSNIGDSQIEKYLSKQFANLFSCYTQSFNKVYGRMGSLFIKNFKREPITDKEYFLNAIVYTHRNPIHHGFSKRYEDWPYSSFNETVAGISNLIETPKLLKIADGLDTFLILHHDSLSQIEANKSFDTP
jgi:putative transposase